MSNNKIINAIIVIYILQKYPVGMLSYNKRPNSLNDVSCHGIKCYGKCKKLLPNIDDNFYPQKKSVYFIETSCIGGLKSRFACSVEAVANTNPKWYIIVLFSGPLKTEFWNSKTYSTLNSIENVYFYRLNTTKFAEDSPVEGIFSKQILSKSLYPVGHTSDFLKILLLYKFGGVYLDLDTIVMKSLDTLPDNFIAKQAPYELASGIMAATKEDVGAEFTKNSIMDLADNYTLDDWNGNANHIYHRALQKICNTADISQMNEDTCQGFYILPHEFFYPVNWRYWMEYYAPGEEFSTESAAYTHHMWNGYGAAVKALHPDSAYVKLAKRYCPKIYQLYGDKFGQ